MQNALSLERLPLESLLLYTFSLEGEDPPLNPAISLLSSVNRDLQLIISCGEHLSGSDLCLDQLIPFLEHTERKVAAALELVRRTHEKNSVQAITDA